MSESYNLFSGELEPPEDGDPDGFRYSHGRFGPRIGAAKLGGTVYELGPGQRICPYHYEYGNEEWLIVLDGAPTLRVPDGERELAAGDVVCFPEGPTGAHDVSNRGTGTVRVLMLSTKNRPDVSVYPDSGKIGMWAGDESIVVERSSAVDYWVGET